MEAEAEAKDLVDKFKNSKPKNGSYVMINTDHAKQCALICVDKIINSMPLEPHTTQTLDYNIAYSEALKFWQEVKEHINKL